MQLNIDEIDSLLLKRAEEEILEEPADSNKKEPALRKAIDKTIDTAKTVGGAALAIPAALSSVNTHMPLKEMSNG